ncbi:uncharacterized protein TA15100 [Theileria annulata]|uniref:Isy1-like splicing family, putative n=1 Tax=Theileria annulata TaxID=5874 RepID=Q4UFB6_THEAN|nr:uncharacterized protein TA15100 [Theileria annulata]CAI74200.1 hypothetical protein, conserved [Theileria annulata]|eukprot:XP_951932.1 hypothetical protein, conserved [Theileria annulata]
MARNSEKANAMLNKWLRIKSGLEQEQTLIRPRHTAEVTNLKEAEKWRSATIKEIMFNINKIQDASLGEFVVRDLNDEINRLIGIRKHWDDRIIELGGTDYRRLSANLESNYGSELKGGGTGYKYFGAAKNLPGVRELFEKQQKEVEQSLKDVSRAELYQMINPDYYGFKDELDEDLLIQEYNKEQELLTNSNVI